MPNSAVKELIDNMNAAADCRVAEAREGIIPVEDVRRAVQFADRYVAAEGDQYMNWLRAKHPNLFTK